MCLGTKDSRDNPRLTLKRQSGLGFEGWVVVVKKFETFQDIPCVSGQKTLGTILELILKRQSGLGFEG